MDRLLVNWGIVGTTFLIALNYGSSLTLSLTFDLYTVVIVCNRGNVLTKVMLQQILHLLDLMAIIQSSITIWWNKTYRSVKLQWGILYAPCVWLFSFNIKAGAQGVSLSDFANAWVAKYHDTHAVGHAFAANLDVDGDHYISYNDIRVMIHRYDANGMYTLRVCIVYCMHMQRYIFVLPQNFTL